MGLSGLVGVLLVLWVLVVPFVVFLFYLSPLHCAWNLEVCEEGGMDREEGRCTQEGLKGHRAARMVGNQ